MRLFGLDITRAKALPSQSLSAVDTTSNRGWFTIYESYSGAWQRNDAITIENVLTHPTVWACVTLIASDIAKMRLRIVREVGPDVWEEFDSPAFSPVLRQPNHYQSCQQFLEAWQLSKLIHGNTYVLKERDSRQVVTKLYVLDPLYIRPLVAPDTSVYYQLKKDLLADVADGVIVPASEIIHDRMAPLYHPLVGIAPIQAAWLAAKQGLTTQSASTTFQSNGATPGGLLMAPGHITTEQATAIKTAWEANYGGDNTGKIAVLGDGLKFESLKVMSAVDAQVVEQLKWGDEKICSVYHVPAYMVGVGPSPGNANVESQNRQYYSQCLGEKAVAVETLLDIGLGLWPDKIDGKRLGVEFNRDDLWQMDTATLIDSEQKAQGLKTPNESRRRLNLSDIEGGDTVYRQQQEYSIEALSKRDAQPDPFAPASASSNTPQPEPDADDEPPDPEDEPVEDVAKTAGDLLRKGLAA